MTDGNEKIEEWMYDFAWILRDTAERGNNILDDKAKNIISYSGILIPAITGFFLFSAEKLNIPKISYVFLVGALIALFFAVYFAFRTTWLSNEKIIPIHGHFNKINDEEIGDILFNTAKDIADWQENLIEINKQKKTKLTISNKCFVASLGLVSSSALYVMFLILLQYLIIFMGTFIK